MKTFKLIITGSKENFQIEYNSSKDFGYNYSLCSYDGSEQERYVKFYKEYKAEGTSPLNIKLKLEAKKLDRGVLKNEVLKYTDVNKFFETLSK